MRINKYLADAKLASRREADRLIAQGVVLVNGVPAVIGQQVSPEDSVTLSPAYKQPRKRYLAYYKGRGVITHSPEAHETDIVGKLAADYGLSGVAPIGRLDKDSEGLMLLSDDGRLTGPLLDPNAGHEREYEVTVDKPISGMFQTIMETEVDIEGYRTKPATLLPHPEHRHRFRLILTEGKKHQIRRMCAALGYQVTTLKRVRIMHIELGSLKPNQFRKLTSPERHRLLADLNIRT